MAQVPRILTGTVKDIADNRPITGANIEIRGKRRTTTTDDQGRFTITVAPNDVLIVSFVGYSRQEIPLRGRSTLEVLLVTAATDLEEVITVGYGTLRKSDVTGSISSVKMENVDETKVASFTEALQGKVSGVNIVTNSGEPGGAVTFNIRGMTSVTGSNQPLIVIDGQPIESSFSAAYAGSGLDGTADAPPADPLASINPNDIESIEILKDASSTAIYGSRGANGVVLITTKTGKGAKDRISFTSRFDVSQLPKKIEMLDSYEYMLYRNEAYVNDDREPLFNQAQLDSVAKMPNTNWQDLVYRNALTQDYYLSVTGNEPKKWNYLLSANYADMQSIIKNAGYKRGSIRLNFDRNIGSKLKISFRTFASYARRNFGSQSNWTGILSGTTVLGALAFNPLQIPFEEGADDDELDMSLTNSPLLLINFAKDHSNIRTFISNFTAEYKITPSLTYQFKAGVNDITTRRNLFYPTGTWLGDTAPDGYASESDNNNYNYVLDHILTFRKIFNKKHSLNAMGGFSWQQWYNRSSSVINMDFPSNTLGYGNMEAAAYPGRYYNGLRSRALSSFIGRINYTYDRRYSIMATGRYDGSSRLSPGHKWLLYPSLGASWNATNEKFFRDNIKSNGVMSSLRLRASVGVAGNDNIAIGGSQASYGLNFYPIGSNIETGYVNSRFENPNLTWERTVQYNGGIDLGFLKDRLNFTVDFYRKVTTDLLIDLSLPVSAGYGSYYTKVGEVTNTGVDIEARYNVLKSKKTSLDLSGNISPVTSKIISMGESNIIYGRNFYVAGNYVLGQAVTAAIPGYAVSSFYGYKTNGIYQNQAEIDNDPALANDDARSTITPGMVRYVDTNGDGLISDADKTVIGDATPDFTYGFSLDLSTGRFSASMTLFGSQGAQLLNMNRWIIGSGHANTSHNQMRDAYEGRWYGEGTSNLYPALTTNSVRLQQRFPDWMVEDASFLRLQNLTLGYLIALPKKMKLGDVKISVTGTNLFTLTQYSGYDPNINAFGQNSLNNGIDLGTLGQARSFSASLKLLF
ncbi:TonB-dependent receptor [Niabella terrae]